jgi:hypothetical protein
MLKYHFSSFQPSYTTPNGRGGKFNFYVVFGHHIIGPNNYYICIFFSYLLQAIEFVHFSVEICYMFAFKILVLLFGGAVGCTAGLVFHLYIV